MSEERADVLVIGAGASGGVLSATLAAQGFSVVCLEQGDWIDRTMIRGGELDWEVTARKQMSADPSERCAPGDYPIDSTESEVLPLMWNGVGGSTLLWAAGYPRLHPSDFRVRSLDGVADDWPLRYADLAPYYRGAEAAFGASGLAGDPAYPAEDDEMPLPPLPIGPAGWKLAETHNRLGWHWWPAGNAIPSKPYRNQAMCAQRGTCMTGCPEGAKASTDLTHWPEAIRHGAKLITGARVSRILTDSRGLATGAEYLDRDGVLRFQSADITVLAANGVGTPRLLLMSADAHHPDGLANSSGLVGRRLMTHPFAVVTGIFEENLDSWQGQFGAQINSQQFYETDADRGFVRGALWSLSPTGGPLLHALPQRAGDQIWGAEHHASFRRRFGRGAAWSIFGEDLPDEENRVELDKAATDAAGLPGAKVRYATSENSHKLIDFHIAKATESLRAAGAVDIEVGKMPAYSGWHLLGTARMGGDPATSVVDRFGRAHDVPNLYVVDGSTFVTAGGVNPTNTIVALTLRTADHLVRTRAEQAVPL